MKYLKSPSAAPDWRESLSKVAAPMPGETPREQIAEAFAQQAYTAIENRTGALMNNENLLGFEVIEANETNNRLVGTYNFRVGDELVMVPVFFLNGAIKGQCLMYLKREDRFVPNTKDQVRALLASVGAGAQGEPIDPRAVQQATMEFDTRSLAAPRNKFAGVQEEAKPLVRDLWKSACHCAWNYQGAETRHIFKEFLIHNPEFKEKAAALAAEDDDFAGSIIVGNSLLVDVEDPLEKRASEAPKLRIIKEEAFESQEVLQKAASALFKYGYAIEDNRPSDRLMEAFEEGKTEEVLRTSPHEVIDYAMDHSGQPVKILIAPAGASPGRVSTSPVEARENPEYIAVALEGEHKGKMKYFQDGPCCVFTDDGPAVEEALLDPNFEDLGPVIPEKGKRYVLFFSSRKRFLPSDSPMEVQDIESDGPVHIVTLVDNDKFVIREDLEETEDRDIDSYRHYHRDETPVFGKDARWVELQCPEDETDRQDPICPGYRQCEQLVLMNPDHLWDRVIKSNGRASLSVSKQAGSILITNKTAHKSKAFGSTSSAAYKLASVGLSAEEAMEIAKRANDGEHLNFVIAPPLRKLAHVWYQREPDIENDFVATGFDSDLQIPIDDRSGVPVVYETRRDRVTRDSSHYGDAKGNYSRTAPAEHIPDEVLLSMTDPARQLSEIAAATGMEHLIDHGALHSLVKTFDAVSMVSQFMGDLEKGVDRLGRIVFLILWKPQDFAERFGEEELPNLENTLVSAFEKHGDLVLELKQQSLND